MIEKKYFVCGGFRHIIHYYENVGEEGSVLILLNKFEVLKDKVINRGEDSEKEQE